MTDDFHRTARALHVESHRGWGIGLALGALLLGLWAVWLSTAEVELNLVSDDARIEVAALPHPIHTEVRGRVVQSELQLDRRVERGDVLLSLDAMSQRLALDEARAKVAANQKVLAVIERLIEAQRAVLDQIGRAQRVAMKETKARADRAQVAARFMQSQAEDSAMLSERGLISKLESLKERADALGQISLARAQRLATNRLAAEHDIDAQQLRVDIERLRLQRSEKEVEMATDEARIARLSVDIERRSVRAPISGRVAWIADRPVGTVVDAQDHVATVLPAGDLRIVAHFPASEALGRIRGGQPATLRLDAYPSTQYGAVKGRVVRVAAEPQQDRLRVEVDLDNEARSHDFAAEHGLQGSLTVGVERVTPVVLLLRALGTLTSASSKSARIDEGGESQR